MTTPVAIVVSAQKELTEAKALRALADALDHLDIVRAEPGASPSDYALAFDCISDCRLQLVRVQGRA